MAGFNRGITYMQSWDIHTGSKHTGTQDGETSRQPHVNWSRPQLVTQKIVQKLKSHESFEVKTGYAMQGLPKFHDLTNYERTETTELILWEKEVSRLVEAANSMSPLRLQCCDGWFGRADRDGYTQLHKLAIQLQDALDICIHDNELLLMEHMPNQVDRKQYEISHANLLGAYDPNQGEERYQRQLRLEKYNDECYHAIVNLVTAMILRVLLRTMRGAFWEENCVITLAKFSAKLKVLTFDLPKAASASLRAIEVVRYRQKEKNKLYWSFNLKQGPRIDDSDYDSDSQSVFLEAAPSESTERNWRDAELRYFLVMKSFHHGISRLLSSTISNLSSNEDTEMSADIFDTSATMYEDYITGRQLLLCAQRDGTISAAADPNVVTAAASAFKVCLEAWESLPTIDENIIEAHRDVWTLVHWKFEEIDLDTGELGKKVRAGPIKLRTVDHVINALVPFLMICSDFPEALQDLSNRVFLISDPTDPVRYVGQTAFLASFGIQSSAYMSRRSELARDPDTFTVLQCSITEQKALAPASAIAASLPGKFADGISCSSSTENDDQSLRQNREVLRAKMQAARKQVEEWVIDEDAIIISYRWYAWGGLSICGLLVIAGLAAGGSIGQRIPGVDPFNISTFSWVLAAFILVVLKSLRVESWQWSRFFRGEVVCKSISEVHAVTGVDPQILLAILLRLEPRTSLWVRGPFGTVFQRRKESGFSIDVPIKTSTLSEGGVILIKVQSTVGPALIAIRSDMWLRYGFISPKGSSCQGKDVVCRDFLDPGAWGTGGDNGPLYKLSWDEEIQWYRIVGIFKTEAYFG